LYSSLHIGLCSVVLYLFSVQRFGFDVSSDYLSFLLASTVFTYSIHRIIGMNKVKKFAHKGRFAVIERFRKHIIVYAIAGGLVSAGLFLAFDRQMQFYLLGAGVISVLYTLPIFGKKMRLRDFSYIKIFLIACVWAYVTETIPLLRNVFASFWRLRFPLTSVISRSTRSIMSRQSPHFSALVMQHTCLWD